MGKTENKPILVGVVSIPFKFELSQLVEVRISDDGVRLKLALSMRMAKTSTCSTTKLLMVVLRRSGLVNQCWKQQKMLVIRAVRYLPS